MTLATVAPDAAPRFVDITVAPWEWAVLIGAVVTFLLIDLLLVHRKPHAISFKEAMIESGVWIALGLSFGVLVGFWHGWPSAGEYLAGYLIEKSLSIDNVFVWAVILSYFAVPPKYQFRVLFWGVFGALVLRAAFIFAGVALIERFDWILYLFGAFLIYTAFKMATSHGSEVNPEDNAVLKLARRFIPSTPEYDGQKLFTVRNGKRLATPLFIVLIMIEATDVVFAVDSVPAILAISQEEFIVFSSNAFAILGLRALYFALAGMADRFRYLHYGLAGILTFVGLKMLTAEIYHFPISLSLGVIALILTASIVVSLRADRRDADAGGHEPVIDPNRPEPSLEPSVSDPTTARPEDREPLLEDR